MRLASVLAASLLLALAGCGSSSSSSTTATAPPPKTTAKPADNGVAALTPAAILAASQKAATTATSVHIAGTIDSGGTPLTLDLQLVQGKGGKGSIAADGNAFDLVAIGNDVYIKGSPEFYRQLGGEAAAKLLQDKWLKAPASGSDYASFAALTSMKTLFDKVLTPIGKTVQKHTTSYAGQPVVAITDAAGALNVAATGKPFPLALIGAKGSKRTGQLVFDKWNRPVTLTAPAGAVDLSQLKSSTTSS